ncbi:splicing factor 3b [Lepidopterella palustris CBS 459.81]|uniref:Splicing factor 3b n=1 Tax=Lepidopterella palustris CBS 459.81 TaxID=1314670 RepID=A0A8E2E4Z1_9PEZI|nr:splicing factor 3b [Lepidopterella palustris CBS 459.81]
MSETAIQQPATKTVSKNARRRALKKAKKHEETPTQAPEPVTEPSTPAPEAEADSLAGSATQVGVAKPTSFDLDFDPEDPLYEQFKDVLEKFQDVDVEDPSGKEPEKPEIFYDDDNDIPDEEDESHMKLSKKARKAQNKLSIAELKALVKKPELVEWTDTSAPDPRLLVSIKAHRNVVPVPNHWSLKREYLSSKRGVEKPPFALPKFIQETGIAEMRDAVLEKQAEQTMKQKQRERVQPKMGKLDIDYQKLYEAFFRRQTKPELTRYGEVYYEGKEYETNLKHMRPGELSEELKEALNIPPGAPPPWLINQQRFGPPPSYPALKIPGLNAPPPPGSTWGFHAGGYGKPPLDEFNRPLYGGDVFGSATAPQSEQLGEPVERTLWGELKAEEDTEEESEEEEEDDDEEDDEDGLQTPSGLETPSGLTSTIPSEFGGAESIGGDFTLRKQRRGTETEESTAPRSAYQVIPEQSIRAQGFFGGDRAYDLKAAQTAPKDVPMLGEENKGRKRKAGDVDISVDVDTLVRDEKLNKEDLKKKYEAQRKAEAKGQWAGFDEEDLSAMIAEESRKRLKKDEERRNRR